MLNDLGMIMAVCAELPLGKKHPKYITNPICFHADERLRLKNALVVVVILVFIVAIRYKGGFFLFLADSPAAYTRSAT